LQPMKEEYPLFILSYLLDFNQDIKESYRV